MKEHTNVRMDKVLKKQLLKEAKAQKRSFTNYVELLLSTHQSRSSNNFFIPNDHTSNQNNAVVTYTKS